MIHNDISMGDMMSKYYGIGIMISIVCMLYGMILYKWSDSSCNIDASIVMILSTTPVLMLQLQLFLSTKGRDEPFNVVGVYIFGLIVNWLMIILCMMFSYIIINGLFANSISCMGLVTRAVFYISILLPILHMIEAVLLYGVKWGKAAVATVKRKLEERRIQKVRNNLTICYDKIFDRSYDIVKILNSDRDLLKSLTLDEREKGILKDFFKYTISNRDAHSRCVKCHQRFDEDELVFRHPQCHHLLHRDCSLKMEDDGTSVCCPEDSLPTRICMIKEMRIEEVQEEILSIS